MDNKLKPGRLLKTLFSIRSSNRQRGALLMGLIAAIVIVSALGAGLIYIFSSSNLNPISGNYAQRAYLNAESGFRYLTALYRVDGNQSLFNVTYQNLSLPSGGTVTVYGTTPNDEATATATVTGSTLNLTILSGTSFPAAPGIFKIGNTSYRYTGKSGNTLSNIRPWPLTGFTEGSTVLTAVQQTKITSTGTFGGGFWNVSRTINYVWPLSGTMGPVNDGDRPPDNQDVTKFIYSKLNKDGSDLIAAIVNAFRNLIALFTGKPAASITGVDVMRWWFEDQGRAIYPSSGCGYLAESWGLYNWDSDESAIKATMADRFFLPYNYNFLTEWQTQDSRLNYDGQTKIKVDGWLAKQYLVGLSVRADTQCWSGGKPVSIHQYGISYAKGHNNKFYLPNSYDPFIVFWRSVGDTFRLIAYKKLAVGDGVIEGLSFFDDMETDPNGWTAEKTGHSPLPEWSTSQSYSSSHSRRLKADYQFGDILPVQARIKRTVNFSGASTATISFWHKRGSVWNNSPSAMLQIYGSGSWHTVRSFTPGADWTKEEPPVQVSNADSILWDLGSATEIRFVVQADGGWPGRAAEMYIDDVQIVAQRLVDYATIGVRVREKGTTDNLSNEFEIFYGDTTSSSGNGTAVVDNNRGSNPRNQTNWMPMPMSKLTSAKDRFTVASSVSDNADTAAANPWYWVNGTAASSVSYTDPTSGFDNCTYTLTNGGSLERSSIIKTSGANCRTTDKIYPNYTSGSAPEEFGIHIYSDISFNTWFDDTNILITGRNSAYERPFQY